MANASAAYSSFFNILNLNLRLLALLLVISIYALWGEPTPDNFGLSELLVGAGLIYVVGFKGLVGAFRFNAMPGWQKAGALFLGYGLSCVLINGLMHGNSLSLIIRDVVPFLFLFLPVFLAGFLRQLDERERLLLIVFVALSGVCFATRVIAPVLTDGNLPAFASYVRDPALLANAPTVLFAAVFLLGASGAVLVQGLTVRRALCAIGMIVLALAPLAAMAAIQQRASVGYLVIAMFFLMAAGICKHPYRMGIPMLMAAAAVVIMAPIWTDIVQTLTHKNALVGFNMRGREASAVMDVIDDSLWSALLGKGWGTTVVSPAVGGAVVNFTHSLVTSTWLKAGLVGVFLMSTYMGLLGFRLLCVVRHNPVLAAAIAGPFLIDIFLYASYKSLDFGLLLLLIPLWVDRAVLLKKSYGCSK